jgi:hypothetical protein
MLAFQGGKNKYYKTIPASSWSPDGGQTTWSQINPPSARTLMSRLVFLTCRLGFTFTGSRTDSGNLLQSGDFALRSHPLANAQQTLNISINGLQISRNINKYIQAILRIYNNTVDRELYESTTTAMADNCQDYSTTADTNDNVLAAYNDSNYTAHSRGTFPYDVFTTTPTTGYFEVTLSEPLHLSPFLDKSYDEKAGLYTVSDMEGLIVWDTNLVAKLLSLNPNSGSTFTSVTATFLQAPSLSFRYLAPSLIGDPIPRNLVYPYTDHRIYQQTVGVIAPGASFQINSQNIQFSCVPDQIMIWFDQVDSAKTLYTADAYAAITSINLDWNTLNGALSSTSEFELYRFSVDAGLRMRYPDWSGGTEYLSVGNTIVSKQGNGSLLVLAPDVLGLLNESEACGQIMQVMFNCQLNAFNPSLISSMNYQLNILACFNGIMSIDESKQTTSNIGIITPMDILDAPESNIDYNAAKRMAEMSGGNVWDSFRNTLSDVWSGVKEIISTVGPIAAPLIGRRLGLGMSGGAMAHRGDLARRLKHY